MQLIILGMHRSGTSMQTRLLNLAGAYFGPEGANTGANDENPKGFWERRDVRVLSDTVLHAAGCDWNRVADLDLSRLPADTREHFNRAAARIVLDMDAYRPWVMKEPRLCLLLPLWRPLLECPVAVNVFRHPVEVAASLRKRDGIPMEVGLAMWKLYVGAAARAAEGLPAVTSFHHDFISRPYEAIGGLIEQLREHEVSGLRMPSRAETEAFVAPSLYRERLSELEYDRRAAAPVIDVFEELKRTGAVPAEISMTEEERILLRRFESGLPPITERVAPRSAAEEKVTELSEALSRTNAAIDRRNERIKVLEHEVRTRREDVAEMERHLRKGRDDAVAERKANEARFRELEHRIEQEHSRASAAAEIAEAEQARLLLEKATLDIRIGRLEAEAGNERRESARKTMEIARLTRLLVARERQLEEQREATGRANSRLTQRGRELGQLKSELDTLARRGQADLHRLEGELRRIHGSMAWKLAAPVRWLSRRVAVARGVGPAGDVRLVERSGLFDRDWYLASYPDIAASGVDPVEHYLLHGAQEGRNPGPRFDTRRYIARYRDVASSGMNPLLHFILHGRTEGRLPL